MGIQYKKLVPPAAPPRFFKLVIRYRTVQNERAGY